MVHGVGKVTRRKMGVSDDVARGKRRQRGVSGEEKRGVKVRYVHLCYYTKQPGHVVDRAIIEAMACAKQLQLEINF